MGGERFDPPTKCVDEVSILRLRCLYRVKPNFQLFPDLSTENLNSYPPTELNSRYRTLPLAPDKVTEDV